MNMNMSIEEDCSSIDLTKNASSEDDEWSRMKLMITNQLDNVTANLDDLRKKGCLESIAFQIERGDRCPSARLISWYLAMLEVEFSSRSEVSKKLHNMFETHSSAKNKKSFVLETHISRAGRALDASDYKSTVERLEGKTNLSIVERQDLWLAKKNIKNEEAKTRKKQAEVRAQSAPILDRSRQSYTTTIRREREPRRTMTSSRRPPTVSNVTRSLSNITNKTIKGTTVQEKGKSKKTRQPISDPFMNSQR
jgi:hypothetical protein